MTVNRRRLLAACGAGLAGLTGCVSSPGDADGADDRSPTGSPSATPTPSRTPTGSPSRASGTIDGLDVRVDSLAPAVLQLYTDAYGVDADGQFLFVHLSADDGAAPERANFEFRLAGASHAPATDQRVRDVARYYDDREGRYDAAAGEGWLLFRLPETVSRADDAALLTPDGEWRPGAGIRERLAAPAPDFGVEWAPPTEVERGTKPDVGLTVTNGGAVARRFVAGINRQGPAVAIAPVVAVSKLLPAGETVSWTVTDAFDVGDRTTEGVGDDEPDFRYGLVWAGGGRRTRVRLVADEDTVHSSRWNYLRG